LELSEIEKLREREKNKKMKLFCKLLGRNKCVCTKKRETLAFFPALAHLICG
jgi:hypothetical protein